MSGGTVSRATFYGSSRHLEIPASPEPTLHRGARYWRCNAAAAGRAVKLPTITQFASMPGGAHFYIHNVGTNAFDVKTSGGTVLATLPAASFGVMFTDGTVNIKVSVYENAGSGGPGTDYDFFTFSLPQPPTEPDGTHDINLRTLCDDAGYTAEKPAQVTLTITSGARVGSTSAGPSLRTGTFPAGSLLTIVNSGLVDGAGGDGGNGAKPNTSVSTPGAVGKTAFKAEFAVTFDNTNGTIRGGGGGGGGGGADMSGAGIAGGAGGGGQGRRGGAAGDVGLGGANPGFPNAPGAGGSLATVGGSGGAWGTAGGAGGNFVNTPPTIYDNGAAGGAAGNAVEGNSFITWNGFGTRIGPII